MKFWRFSIPAACILLSGCSSGPREGAATLALPPAPTSSTRHYPILKGPIEELEDVPWCIYYISADDGNVWRCSIDGMIRELVLKTRMDVESIGPRSFFTGQAEGPGPAALSLDTGQQLPGITYLDERSARDQGLTRVRRITSRTTDMLRGFGPRYDSHWQEFALQRKGGTGRNYSSTYTVSIVLRSRASRPKRFDFDAFGNSITGPLAIFKSRFYVIYDFPNLILWDLRDDQRWLIARTPKFSLWPRDLRKAERFSPIRVLRAEGKDYKWRISNPEDLQFRPAYVAPSQSSEATTNFPLLKHSIPELASEPFCLYLIRPEDRNIWRYSLDGSKRELALVTSDVGEESQANLHFRGYYSMWGNGQDLTLFDFPKDRSSIIDEHISEPRRIEIFGNARDPDSYAPWVRPRKSSWSLSYHSDFDLAANSVTYGQNQLILEDGSGRVRKHRSQNNRRRPTAVVGAPSGRGILGLFHSRYILLYEGSTVVLWDLRDDNKWRIANADDVRLWPRDMNRQERYVPKLDH